MGVSKPHNDMFVVEKACSNNSVVDELDENKSGGWMREGSSQSRAETRAGVAQTHFLYIPWPSVSSFANLLHAELPQKLLGTCVESPDPCS